MICSRYFSTVGCKKGRDDNRRAAGVLDGGSVFHHRADVYHIVSIFVGVTSSPEASSRCQLCQKSISACPGATLRQRKTTQANQLPELLTEDELRRFYTAVWNGFNRTHAVMLKILFFTGTRNAELANLTLDDVDLSQMRIRTNHRKGDELRWI